METIEKPIQERVKTFEDACTVAGLDPKSYESPADASEEEKHLNDYRKLLLICRVLNDGWKPDFNDYSQWKYWPWFVNKPGSGFSYCGCDCGLSSTAVGARLCYKSRELAKYAGTQFQDIYNQYLSL